MLDPITQRRRLEKKTEHALLVFDPAEAAVEQIHQALELFADQGPLCTRAPASAEVQQAVQTLECWEEKNLPPIIPQSQNPKRLTFFSWAETQRGRVGLTAAVRPALCLVGFCRHQGKMSKYLTAK